MMDRLINAGKKQSSFWGQCRYLRRCLLKAFGGLDALQGEFLPSYVFDMKHNNRRLCRRRDLIELYRLLLCESREIAITIENLLSQSEATILPLTLELVEHYTSITELNIVYAAECSAPQMQLDELAQNCLLLLRHVVELLGAWKIVSSELQSDWLCLFLEQQIQIDCS